MKHIPEDSQLNSDEIQRKRHCCLYENIANMEDGELKDDLLFLNTYHDELYIPKEMSWEEAYNL